tara:strand:+ start:193 stop:627 length:435 start_codon:yes stop_codon:yes gene_type:complete
MVKNIIINIFIYILLIGCESPLVCEDCYLDISAPSLQMDENGYYHMKFLGSYTQTFSTLEAQTGITGHNQKVKWLSNRKILIAGHWTDLVNNSSYTDEDDGKAYTVVSAWKNFVGDTVKVYSGYTDNCDILHVDSLEIVINNGE